MSSAGQIIGGIAGGIVSFFVPGLGFALGASIGMAIGGYIDPPKGPKLEGPRLNDLSVQLTGYGNPIPRVYGTTALMGTIFWVENNALKETVTTQESGGKGGGGGQETTTYSYSATFALGLCQGPIDGIKRIWIGGKLVYDAGDPSVGAILASANFSGGGFLSGSSALNEVATWWLNALSTGKRFTLYKGTADQLPDPRMQAALGVADTPAYRGLAYLVFEDLQLADFGNSLMGAQIKVEVVNDATNNTLSELVAETLDVSPTYASAYATVRAVNANIRCVSTVFDIEAFDQRSVFCQSHPVSTARFIAEASSATPAFAVSSFFEGKGFPKVLQSDVDASLFVLSLNSPTATHVIAYNPAGVKIMDSGPQDVSVLPSEGLVNAVIKDGTVFFAYSNGSKIYSLPLLVYGDMPASESGDSAPVMASASTYNIEQFDVSETYLYAVDRATSTSTSTTVLKFDKNTLEYIESFTAAFKGTEAKIVVVGDDSFYTLTNTGIFVYWNATSATDTGLRYTQSNIRFDQSYLVQYLPGVFYILRPGDTDPMTDGAELFMVSGYISANTTTLESIINAECLMSRLLTAGDINTTALTSDVRGYRVAQTAALRSALDPLQAAWPFDVVQSGYGIKFLPRGQGVVATIDISELGAAAGGEKSAIRITNSREMDLQLPRRVELTHLDAEREYDTGEQAAERINTDAINILRMELPIVLTADEAAQKAEVLLYLYWLERSDISFTLPPTYGQLEAADVITINGDAATYEVRLTSINLLPDGRLECSGKYNNAAVYSSTAVGSAGAVLGKVLTLDSQTNLILLDAPTMMDVQDAPGFVAVGYGDHDGWKGGVLVRSDDSGQTWKTLEGLVAPATTVGRVVYPVLAGRTDIKDATNVITVNLLTGSLSSVTEAQMLNGANHFAVGADGRWEIIAAQSVNDNGDGTFGLYNLLRGRYGTEWAIGTSQTLDAIVLLDSARLAFIGINSNSIGAPMVYRGVSKSYSINSASDVPFTYRGANLECLSPVYANGYIDNDTGDWYVTWQRRTRVGGEWRDLVDASLGETSEAYEVEIWDSIFNTLKRTVTGLTSPSFTWTAAQQVADFLVEQQSIRLRIYQVSPIVGRGYPLQVAMTRANYVSTDPEWANVSLLLHGNGTDGTQNIGCETGRALTVYGNTKHSSTQWIFGGSAIYFDGAGDRITAAEGVAFASSYSSEMSIEVRVWIDAGSSSRMAIFHAGSGGYASGDLKCLVDYSAGNGYYMASGCANVGGSSTYFQPGAWATLGYFKKTGGIDMYLNGNYVGTGPYYSNDSSDDKCTIGAFGDGSDGFKGYMDEFRLTNNVQRQTANYTPATEEFPSV